MKKNRLFFKIFTSSKNFIGLILISLLSTLLILTSLILVEINKDSTLENIYNVYGKYTVSISDPKVLECKQICNEKSIKDSLWIMEEEISVDDVVCIKEYADERILDFKNISIVEGDFPSSKGEVAVERSILFEMGIEEEKMLGALIDVPVDDEGNCEQFEVSAIITRKNIFENQSDVGKYFLFNDKGMYNSLLVELNDVENYKEVLDEICLKYDLDKEQFYVNFNLFTALGITMDENVLKDNNSFYYFLYFSILICVILIIYNYVKITILKVRKEIAIMNLIGIANDVIQKKLFEFLLGIMLLGSILGVGAGIIISYIISNNFIGIQKNMIDIIGYIPLTTFAISMVVYYAVVLLTILPLIVRLNRMMPNDIIKYEMTSTKTREKRVFSKKSKNFSWSMAKYNISENVGAFILSIMGIVISMSVLIIGLFYIKTNLRLIGYSNDMDYEIFFVENNQFYQDYEGAMKKRNDMYMKLSQYKEYCSVYPAYEGFIIAELEIDKLGDKYIKYLKGATDNLLTLELGNANHISTEIYVLGYNEEMLKELYEENGLKYHQGELGKNEAVVLGDTLSFNDSKGFNLKYNEGDRVILRDYIYNRKDEFTIKHIIDKLTVYPNGILNKVCIIVNEEEYKRIFDIIAPQKLYIELKTDDYDEISKIKETFLNRDDCVISLPKEYEQEIKEGNLMLKTIILSFFSVIFISVVVSFVSTILLRIYMKKNEYAVLQVLGIDAKRIKKIIMYETIAICAVGIVISSVISYAVTYYMHITTFGIEGKYLYEYPFSLVVCAMFIIVLILCVTVYFATMNMNKMTIVDTIKKNS